MKLLSVPCKCGWKFPGSHVCVDPDVPLDPAVARKHGIRTKTLVAAVTDEQREKFEAYADTIKDREAEMVRRYLEGFGIKKIAEDMGAGHGTVLKALNRAQDAGVVKIRPRGTNTRYRAHQEA